MKGKENTEQERWSAKRIQNYFADFPWKCKTLSRLSIPATKSDSHCNNLLFEIQITNWFYPVEDRWPRLYKRFFNPGCTEVTQRWHQHFLRVINLRPGTSYDCIVATRWRRFGAIYHLHSYPKSQLLKKIDWVSQTDRFSSGRGFPVVDVRAIEEPDQERRLSTNHHNLLYVQPRSLKMLK